MLGYPSIENIKSKLFSLDIPILWCIIKTHVRLIGGEYMNKLIKGSNLKWISSKFLLHEHSDLLVTYKKEALKKEKPIIDEQTLEEFASAIQESIVDGKQVKIFLFNEYQDKIYQGVITKINTQYRKIKLQMDDDFDWISLSDITDILLL